MKAKIDLEKFICSYVKWNNIQDALKDQGLKCCNGEIVEIPQENEDERIKKEILELISISGNGNQFEEIKDWLEKQGEQKQTMAIPKWKYKKDSTPLLQDSIILNKYGCVAKSPSGAIVSDVWILNYNELAKLPKEKLEQESTDKVEPKFKKTPEEKAEVEERQDQILQRLDRIYDLLLHKLNEKIIINNPFPRLTETPYKPGEVWCGSSAATSEGGGEE